MRGLVHVCCAFAVFGSAVSVPIHKLEALTASKGKSPEYEVYWAMDDPREAATLLRAKAEELGFDIQKPFLAPGQPKHPGYQIDRVLLWSDSIDTEAPSSQAYTEVNSLVQRGLGSEQLVCIAQLHESMCLADLLTIMEMGVRIYRPVPWNAFIVRMPANRVLEVAGLDIVKWIGLYSAEYKYKQGIEAGTWPTIVYAFERDKPEFREDLRRLGIGNASYSAHTGAYSFEAPSTLVPKLAQLTWIRRIGVTTWAPTFD